MPSLSPLPHETGAFSQKVEVKEKEVSQSASSPLPENSAADNAMPYMPLNDEPPKPAEEEDQAAIAQLANEIMNGDDDSDDSIHTAFEKDGSPSGDVAKTPATVKSVGRRKTPASAKMTPASVHSAEAKVASASGPQRVTPRGKSNITNGTATTASTSRKRGSTGPLSGRAAKKTKVVEDDEDEYEVEAIVDDGIDDDTYEHMYEVKWKGYDDTTWEPLTNLTHCKDLITAYEKAKKSTTSRNASGVSGRGRGRGAGKTSAAKAATGKPAAGKSSRGRGRGRGRPATTARASKAEAEKVATEKIAAAKKKAASKARAARAAASASKRTATNASAAKKSRGGKATRGGRGRPRRSA